MLSYAIDRCLHLQGRGVAKGHASVIKHCSYSIFQLTVSVATIDVESIKQQHWSPLRGDYRDVRAVAKIRVVVSVGNGYQATAS
jgi:hypothetical protein